MDDKKLPLQWIDRIFYRLSEIYGDRFAMRFTKESYLNIEKTQWRSGLIGATADEIKHVIDMCKDGLIKDPPTVVEFYHYCKRIKQPAILLKEEPRNEQSQKLGADYLKIIRDKLHGRNHSNGSTSLPSND